VATGPPPGRDGWRVAVASIEGADRPAEYLSLRDAAVSVMGAVKGLALVESTPGASAFVVEEAAGVSRTYESSRWRAER
jgi:hypothetical protein